MAVENWIRCYVMIDMRAYYNDDEMYLLIDCADEISEHSTSIVDVDACGNGKRWSIDMSVNADVVDDPASAAEDLVRHCCSMLRSSGVLSETDVIVGSTTSVTDANAWFKHGTPPPRRW